MVAVVQVSVAKSGSVAGENVKKNTTLIKVKYEIFVLIFLLV